MEINKKYKLKELIEIHNTSTGDTLVYKKQTNCIKAIVKELEQYYCLQEDGTGRGKGYILKEIYSTPIKKEDERGTNPSSHGHSTTRDFEQWKCDKSKVESIGVYKIVLGNKIYIGSTTASFRQRFLQHKSISNPLLSTKKLMDNGGVFSIVKEMNGCTEDNIRREEQCYITHYLNNKNWECVNMYTKCWNDKEQNFIEVRNKYLAEALAFFNFKYYKFNIEEGGKTIYSFEDTKEFREMKDKLIKMKKEIA